MKTQILQLKYENQKLKQENKQLKFLHTRLNNAWLEMYNKIDNARDKRIR